MKENELSNDEKNFLRLLARNIWIARVERAIVGCLYTLGIGLLLYLAVFELGPGNPVSAICYVGILAIGYDAYHRVFKQP